MAIGPVPGRLACLFVIEVRRTMPLPVRLALLIALIALPPARPVQGEGPFESIDAVARLLESRCLECHGADRSGGLRLDRHSDALLPTDAGEPAIVPGDPAAGTLLARVTFEDDSLRMPPDGEPLSDDEIELLSRWIAAGAPPVSEDDAPAVHWAYQRPQRWPLPQSPWDAAARGPIDRRVAARLEAAGLEPSAAAERGVLLRRVSLALVGLPPTPEQVAAFESDARPDAYERVVDRLLASPAFGEHWARHWLDLARYADSNGFQADQLRDSWAYRDWVIDALNADMPVDQFTIEQMAGDLLPEATVAQRIATGFHRAATCNVEAGVDPEENRVNQVFDRVDTTGTVFLGTTLECAQCHNHKYDPITQRDYYQLFAFFNNTPLEVENDGGGVQFEFAGPTMELPQQEAETQQRRRLEAEIERLQQGRRARMRSAARRRWEAEQIESLAAQQLSGEGSIPDEVAAALEVAADDRTAAQRQAINRHFAAHDPEIQQLDATLAELRERLDPLQPPTTLVMVEMDSSRETFLLRRGDFQSPAVAVQPDVPEVLHAWRDPWPRNRLGLAYWLVDRENPLTARVFVNRWWGELFGQPLVRSPEDLGTRSEPPSHPELLDDLAVELIESRWSMKRLLRQIVTSRTFRQSSHGTEASRSIDPDNRMLSRGPRMRMTAETIRDNALAAAGMLTTPLGGPPVMPHQPPAIWRAVGRNAPKWEEATDGDRFRRGVYIVWRRAAPYPSFVTFDAPDRAACTVRRPTTNTPLQALALLNDRTYAEAACGLAHRLLVDHPQADDAARIEAAFVRVLARRPNESQRQELQRLLDAQRRQMEQSPETAQQRLSVVEPFLPLAATVDRAEWAAWSIVAAVLLNLDETITRP